MLFLIDECLSTALVQEAQNAGHQADHVTLKGWSGYKDWQLMPIIEANDYLFVTNNRVDFVRLHGGLQLHEGLVIIVPNVPRAGQVHLFKLALSHIGTLRDLVNTVLEVDGNAASYTLRVRALAMP